jgi:hypothetical protein
MPEPGNLTICDECGALLEFGEELMLSVKDITSLPVDVQLQIRTAQYMLRMLKATAEIA